MEEKLHRLLLARSETSAAPIRVAAATHAPDIEA